MRSWSSLLAAVSLTTYGVAFPSGPHDTIHELARRNIVYDGQIANSYDFVIVGGGTAGLVLASRLSEDSNTTVLVLEAGDTGDAVKNTVDIPGNAYYVSLLGSSYDWAYTTVPQAGANQRSISWPAGKLLGGSSAINGMYNVRPAQVEVDAWASMIEGGDVWKWDNLFAAMKKGEDFTPPTSDVQTTGNIEYAAQSHGTSGPLHVSYPGFMVPVVGDWTETLANIGIPKSSDAYAGENWGGFIAASDINPTNWTRSYARSAYIDPLPPRPNLSILPNATVTRLIFTNSSSGNITASSVEYAASRDAARLTVNVTKEVILAGGAMGSPRVLMHSGVGPSDVLAAADVDVVHALPGVGQHLQDHISTELVWKTDVETAASIHAANYSNYDDYDVSTPFLSFINSATCYANTSMLLGSDAANTFISNVASAIDTSASSLVPSTDPTVIAGYKAIYNTTAQLLSSPIGQIEILLSLTGSGVGAESIAIQAALQHPFSQGRLYINSSDPFDHPVIDPQYLSHTADLEIFREGLKLVRTIGNTAPLNSALLQEVTPGSSVQSDDDWNTWLATQYSTEFHPSCSLAMLPLEQGGVVDANLKVYGLSNVRVVDASVFPFAFSAHMMAPVYGLAEQAANIIRAQYNGVTTSTNTSTSSSSAPSPSSTSTSGTTAQTDTAKSGASLTRPDVALSLLTLVACVFAAL